MIMSAIPYVCKYTRLLFCTRPRIRACIVSAIIPRRAYNSRAVETAFAVTGLRIRFVIYFFDFQCRRGFLDAGLRVL